MAGSDFFVGKGTHMKGTPHGLAFQGGRVGWLLGRLV